MIVLAVLGYGLGSLIGKKAAVASPTPITARISPTPTTDTSVNSAAPLASGPIAAQQTSMKTIHAGVKTDVFSPYSLTVNPGWTENHIVDSSGKTDKLLLSKSGYVLTILQDNAGAGVCLYPGDSPQPMAQSFTTFSGIPGIKLQYRRGTSDGSSYTVCQKIGDHFAFPTEFGFITYSAPSPVDNTLLNDMDAMVASLSK